VQVADALHGRREEGDFAEFGWADEEGFVDEEGEGTSAFGRKSSGAGFVVKERSKEGGNDERDEGNGRSVGHIW